MFIQFRGHNVDLSTETLRYKFKQENYFHTKKIQF